MSKATPAKGGNTSKKDDQPKKGIREVSEDMARAVFLTHTGRLFGWFAIGCMYGLSPGLWMERVQEWGISAYQANALFSSLHYYAFSVLVGTSTVAFFGGMLMSKPKTLKDLYMYNIADGANMYIMSIAATASALTYAQFLPTETQLIHHDETMTLAGLTLTQFLCFGVAGFFAPHYRKHRCKLAELTERISTGKMANGRAYTAEQIQSLKNDKERTTYSLVTFGAFYWVLITIIGLLTARHFQILGGKMSDCI
eukprot:Clim_evm44s210 gene=Clim_evmTU44s210